MVLHNGGGDTLLVLLLVLILIYESNITISNESGEARRWSAARTLFATFCSVIARGYYLYQRAKCFQHSHRRNCSSESGIDWAVFAEQLPGYAVHRPIGHMAAR